MKNIVENIKKMNLLQKLQVISGVIPFYSFLFVFVTSFIVNLKAKKGWVLFAIVSAIYFSVLFLTSNLPLHFAIKYAIWLPLSVIGNYLLVSLIQIKNT